MDVPSLARAAKAASIGLGALSRDARDGALAAVRAALLARAEDIFAANRADLERAGAEGLAAPLLKRLRFDRAKLDEVVAGIDSLIGLADPLGRELSRKELAPGLTLRRESCPLGVIGMVFESRPDALVQIAGLCLKSGNAVLLKGGREARETNAALAGVVDAAARSAGIPALWLANLESREEVDALLAESKNVDLLVPRGSKEFVKSIMARSAIPVMGHADGVCHVYVDAEADPAMAIAVCVDSKAQYAAACNAAETFLVHAQAAPSVLPGLAAALREAGVEIRGCERTRALIDCAPADDSDWSAEYLDLVVAIRVVDSLDEALAHIAEYGSRHTDAIVSASAAVAERFMAAVDSADVFWNASTRFADGFRFGLGAELGISTSKLHARGPVGLEGLCTYKWKLYGHGDLVADFASGRRTFTHRDPRS